MGTVGASKHLLGLDLCVCLASVLSVEIRGRALQGCLECRAVVRMAGVLSVTAQHKKLAPLMLPSQVAHA
jgi:hypothetical protein